MKVRAGQGSLGRVGEGKGRERRRGRKGERGGDVENRGEGIKGEGIPHF